MTLKELIPSYGEHKTEFDILDKQVKEENAEIKKLILESGEMKHEVDGWKASVTVSKRENFNEDKLIKILQSGSEKLEDIASVVVKFKPYVDFDALEEAIYRGDIDKDTLLEMDKAKESKEVVTLRISKVKEKK